MKVSNVKAPKGKLKWNIGDRVWKVERYWNKGKFIFPIEEHIVCGYSVFPRPEGVTYYTFEVSRLKKLEDDACLSEDWDLFVATEKDTFNTREEAEREAETQDKIFNKQKGTK